MALSWIDFGLIILILGVLIWVLMTTVFNKKKRFIFTVRMLTGSKQVIIRSPAVEIKDAKGISKLKIKKLKETITMPPADAIDIDISGKFFVEAYRDRYGNYTFISDKGIEKTRNPITSNQQIILADQIIKAHTRKKDWTQFIPTIAGLGFIVIIFVSAMLFIKEPIEALDSFAGKRENAMLKSQELDLEIIQSLDNLRKEVQIIRSQTAGDINIENPPN